MTTAHTPKTPRWSGWLDLSRYDRQSTLTPDELQAIRDFACERKHAPVFSMQNELKPVAPDSVLYRLFQPLYDVWTGVGTASQESRDALTVLCREMAARQSAYWAWTDADWCEILGFTQRTFRERYAKNRNCRRVMLLISYLLCGFTDVRIVSVCRLVPFADDVFGRDVVQPVITTICEELQAWGYSPTRTTQLFPHVVALLLIVNRSPYLEDLTTEIVTQVRNAPITTHLTEHLYPVSHILAQLGHIDYAVDRLLNEEKRQRYSDTLAGVPDDWVGWAVRWRETTTITLRTRQSLFRNIIKVGRWVATTDPAHTSPTTWTRDTALAFVAAVDRMRVGEWVTASAKDRHKRDKPLMPATKAKHLSALRTFFRDGQDWGWFERRFDPQRCFATPRPPRASSLTTFGRSCCGRVSI